MARPEEAPAVLFGASELPHLEQEMAVERGSAEGSFLCSPCCVFPVPFPLGALGQPRLLLLLLQVWLGWLGHQRAAGFAMRGRAPAPSLSIFYPHVIASNIPSNTIPQETKGPIQRLHAPHGRVLFIYWKPDLKPGPT